MKQHNNIETRLQLINSIYKEIFDLLKTGGNELIYELKESRKVKLSDKVRDVRKQLDRIQKFVFNNPESRHIPLLTAAIRNVAKQLEQTKKELHSKVFCKIREHANDLLDQVETKYCEAIEKI